MPKRKSSVGPLAWSLPAAHVLHVAEEYWGNFPRWLNATVGTKLSLERFFELNAFFWLAMAIGVFLGTRLPPARMLLIALATVVITNGTLHALGTVVTASYSPGAVTGLLLWIPLGVALIGRVRREVSRLTIALGVILGIGLHGLVTVAAVSAG